MKAVAIDDTAGGLPIVTAPHNAPFIHLWNNGPNTVYLRYDGDTDKTLTTTVGWPLALDSGLFLNNDAGGKNPFIFPIHGICAAAETADIRVQMPTEQGT